MRQVTHRNKILHAVLAAVVSAYGQNVHYSYDRDTSVASYKTYQWVGPDGTVGDHLIDRDIKRSIDEQLALKGLTKVESGADLYVGYKAALEVEKAVDLRSTGFGGQGGLGDRTLQAQTSTVPFGTLIVSLYDPARNRLIWRGDATNAVDLKKDPGKNYKKLQKAMVKLFKNYPPQPGK